MATPSSESTTSLTCPRCGGHSVTRHVTVLPSEPYAQLRDEGYRCGDCRHQESCGNESDDYELFRDRWNDPIVVPTPEEVSAQIAETNRIRDEQEREWTWPLDSYSLTREERAEFLAQHIKTQRRPAYTTKFEEWFHLLPTNQELFAQVLARPDDDAPRRAYASWLRTIEHPLVPEAAALIERQLEIYNARRDRHADMKRVLASVPDDRVFESAGRDGKPVDSWWRHPNGYEPAAYDFTYQLLRDQVIADQWHGRGFVEHVAIKAARFLELADELYSLAPIRHLTLTYCKGLDHKDTGLWKAVLESPHLDRIRSLQLYVKRDVGNQYTELNRFTDDDIELLAGSTHLRGLAYLDLAEHSRLTIRAFDVLARSPNLPALSFVGHDLYRHDFAVQSPWGGLGPLRSTLVGRPLASYAAELEARHGRIAWLHPVENYGSETPDIESVVARPVALEK